MLVVVADSFVDSGVEIGAALVAVVFTNGLAFAADGCAEMICKILLSDSSELRIKSSTPVLTDDAKRLRSSANNASSRRTTMSAIGQLRLRIALGKSPVRLPLLDH